MARVPVCVEIANEAEALRLAQHGNANGFAYLYELHQGGIYKICLRVVRNVHDAEDVMQETFTKAYEHIAEFHGGSDFKTWLVRIALNEACRLLNKKKKKGKWQREEVSLEAYLEPHGPGGPRKEIADPSALNPYAVIHNEELSVSIARAMKRLSETQRLHVHLRMEEGLQHKEIAQMFGISEPCAKGRLHRTLYNLQPMLRHWARA